MGVSFTFIIFKAASTATTTANLYTLFPRTFEKKMIRGGTMWDQTDGCEKHYMCSIP